MLWLLAWAVILALWPGMTTHLFAEENQIEPAITCMAAANYPASGTAGAGILLAWRVNITDTTTFQFEVARAQFTSPQGELRGPLIPVPELQQSAGEPDADELRYAVVDVRVADQTKYAYVLTMTNTISGTVVDMREETWTYDADPNTPLQNDEICLSSSTRTPWAPTSTATATDTLTPLPSDTPTPTVTATPTWTPTPTITPTPTWTVTFTPGPTDTPYPSPTFTPLPTETPIPPTETASPTFTVTPTPTPAIGTPTPEFGASQFPDPASVDPFSSLLPTPTWTVETFAAPAPAFDEAQFTATPSFLFDATPLPDTTFQEAAPAIPAEDTSADLGIQPETAAVASVPEDNQGTLANMPAARPMVRSEYPLPPPQLNSSPILRVALYAVGGLAALSAIAFLVGALALFGTRNRS